MWPQPLAKTNNPRLQDPIFFLLPKFFLHHGAATDLFRHDKSDVVLALLLALCSSTISSSNESNSSCVVIALVLFALLAMASASSFFVIGMPNVAASAAWCLQNKIPCRDCCSQTGGRFTYLMLTERYKKI